MSYATAAYHCPTELAFVDADDILHIVHFAVASKTDPATPNIVALDVLTGETHCSCKGAQCGRECWHQTLAMAAWEGHPTRVLAGKYNDDQLSAAGRKAHTMCTVYRARCGRCLPDDQIALVACRCAYRARRGVVAHALAA